MALPKNTATFEQVLRSPATYMLMVAVSLLWVFTYAYKNSNDLRNEDLAKENAELRKAAALDRAERLEDKSIIRELTIASLVKNGVIIKLRTRNSTQDSLLQAGEENKQ